jgi:hypothetical protein
MPVNKCSSEFRCIKAMWFFQFIHLTYTNHINIQLRHLTCFFFYGHLIDQGNNFFVWHITFHGLHFILLIRAAIEND